MDFEEFKDKADMYLNGKLDGEELASFESSLLVNKKYREYLKLREATASVLFDFISKASNSGLKDFFQFEDKKPFFDLKMGDLPIWKKIQSLGSINPGYATLWLLPDSERGFSLQGTTRGDGASSPEIVTLPVGYGFIFSVEMKGNDGYVVLLHLDPEGEIDLVHPLPDDRETFIPTRGEKDFRLVAREPFGRHIFKAIITRKDLLKAQDLDFSSSEAVGNSIASYLNEVAKLPAGELSIKDEEYEVIPAE